MVVIENVSKWKLSFKVYRQGWKGPSLYCYPFSPYILIHIINKMIVKYKELGVPK
jgi:hypothetical protein